MQTFIMLTALEEATIDSPHMLERREQEVMAYIRNKCPDVEWLASYVTLGPYDYVNVVEAPDNRTIAKISMELGARGTMEIMTLAAVNF